MKVLLDLHVHSNASYDCILKPSIIAKQVKKMGLDGFALTDHDTLRNIDEAAFYAKKYNLIFIPGIEKKTNKEDILALFVRENINLYKFDDVINEIRLKRGIAILPHPFKSHKNLTKRNWEKLDAIEVLNGRCSDTMNMKSEVMSNEMVKVGGSDAHTWWEVGTVFTELFLEDGQQSFLELIKEAIKNGHTSARRKKKFNYQQYLWTIRYSRMIKAVKEGHLAERSIDLGKRIFCQKR